PGAGARVGRVRRKAARATGRGGRSPAAAARFRWRPLGRRQRRGRPASLGGLLGGLGLGLGRGGLGRLGLGRALARPALGGRGLGGLLGGGRFLGGRRLLGGCLLGG